MDNGYSYDVMNRMSQQEFTHFVFELFGWNQGLSLLNPYQHTL